MSDPLGKYILRGHKPVRCHDLFEWARWFEKADRCVAEDYVGGARISTVFLGLDHQFMLHGPPLLFETLVFGGPLDGEQERYATWDEAVAGHQAMVKRALGGLQ